MLWTILSFNSLFCQKRQCCQDFLILKNGLMITHVLTVDPCCAGVWSHIVGGNKKAVYSLHQCNSKPCPAEPAVCGWDVFISPLLHDYMLWPWTHFPPACTQTSYIAECLLPQPIRPLSRQTAGTNNHMAGLFWRFLSVQSILAR